MTDMMAMLCLDGARLAMCFLMTFWPSGAGAVGVDGPLTASLCQNEVVASQTQETVRGPDYSHRHG
ncbi:hypothetical protein J4G37_34010, partial [Microvirga sp. 3-52]|nr:hypothetical protein [Microvirga sp. 3-52]